jgi:hypothetical protein
MELSLRDFVDICDFLELGVVGHQFFPSIARHHSTLIHHNDLITPLHGAQAMCDY